MNLGTENRKKVVIAGALLLLALFVVIRNFSSSSSEPAASTAPAASTQAAQPVLGGKGPAQILPEASLDPRLRLELLATAQNVEYKGTGRNIFRAGAEPPKPLPKTIAPAIVAKPGLPPPPSPINLKYFGFASRPGGASKVFLAQGDDVFVASEGDIVNRRYKILRVTPNSIEVEDVINNVRQTLPLSAG